MGSCSSISSSSLGSNSVRHSVQILRTSRCARIASTVAVIRNGGNAHVAQTRDGRRGVVGVQRAEDQVAR